MPGDRQRILLMRHPETTANLAGTLSGRSDVDLSPEGERQMARAVEALVAWEPDRVWSSPLSRCLAIAREAAWRLGVPLEVRQELAEIEFGPAQGLTVGELRAMGYDFPWALGPDGRSRAPEGAERFEELFARAHGLLEALRPLGGRTACVTHGGLTRAVLASALQIPLTSFWRLRLPNVSSQVLACDGTSYTLVAIGLAPEEVRRRAEDPSLLGRDTTENIAEGSVK
ncbi:histidine phosphatase family protein [Olsenella phocaeensis]|uniref:histidine phosphatase family protein n=1 Tax=Olsenella phocaeensis TaxID=1852385 RepID=UPI003A8CB44B